MNMKNNKSDTFNWVELLERIDGGEIVPVIGQGLYWVEVDGQERLLYDFLAEKLAEEVGVPFPSEANHKFSKAAFQFLEKQRESMSDFVAVRTLRKFLLDILKPVKPADANPLWKLARIKAFKFFINTTYDEFLVNTVKRTRDYPTRVLHYTLKAKNMDQLDDELFNSLKHSKCTLVYNLYGNLQESVDAAFTEKDILETIVKFQKDMEVCRDNRFFQELEGNGFLFIGCGYKDWLFRFFIRIICSKPYQYPKGMDICKFIGDDFGHEKEAPANELLRFLKSYDTEVYYSGGGKCFVDTLFQKLEQNFPGTIIPVTEFPETAFISFHGANRRPAKTLANGLQACGINVWLDEKEFDPGDEVDGTIINAIEKCPVFIPLISGESKSFLLENGKMKYHCQEWNWVCLFNKRTGIKPKTIIPVIIDGTDWMYDKFKDFYSVKIPGGKSGEGEFEKLRRKLEEVQRWGDRE